MAAAANFRRLREQAPLPPARDAGARAALARWAAALGLIAPDEDAPPADPPASSGVSTGSATQSHQEMPPPPTARAWNDTGALERARREAYVDYDDMDLQFPEFSRGLDVVADMATSNDRGDKSFTLKWTTGVEEALRVALEDCVDRLRLREVIRSVCRSAKKTGDLFAEPVPDGEGLLVDLQPRAASTMDRIEDSHGALDRFEQWIGGTLVARFAPGQIVHLRPNREWGARYGTSMLKAARFIFRQYGMMSDAVVLNRLTRAVQRYLFLIDVAGMQTDEAKEHVRWTMEMNWREPIVDSLGRLDLRTKALADSDNLFLPQKTSGVGDVKVLQGATNVGNVNDLRIFYRRLLVVTPVPPVYLGVEEDVNSKATAVEQGINFARYLRATQQSELASFVFRVLRRQAALLGKRLEPADLRIVFGRVSITDENVRAATLKLQAEAARILGFEMGWPTDFLVRYVLDLPDDEADAVLEHLRDLDDEADAQAGGAAPAVAGRRPGGRAPPPAEARRLAADVRAALRAFGTDVAGLSAALRESASARAAPTPPPPGEE